MSFFHKDHANQQFCLAFSATILCRAFTPAFHRQWTDPNGPSRNMASWPASCRTELSMIADLCVNKQSDEFALLLRLIRLVPTCSNWHIFWWYGRCPRHRWCWVIAGYQMHGHPPLRFICCSGAYLKLWVAREKLGNLIAPASKTFLLTSMLWGFELEENLVIERFSMTLHTLEIHGAGQTQVPAVCPSCGCPADRGHRGARTFGGKRWLGFVGSNSIQFNLWCCESPRGLFCFTAPAAATCAAAPSLQILESPTAWCSRQGWRFSCQTRPPFYTGLTRVTQKGQCTLRMKKGGLHVLLCPSIPKQSSKLSERSRMHLPIGCFCGCLRPAAGTPWLGWGWSGCPA